MYRSLVPVAIAVLIAAACTHTRGLAGDATIRVLVYNIHAGKDAGGVDNLERVAALIRETHADIALLQEVDRNTDRSGHVDQVAVLSERSGLAGVLGKSLDYQHGDYGIAGFSRWKMLSDSVVHLPVTPPQERAGGSHEPRALLSMRIAHPLGEIPVLTTHLDASRDTIYRAQEVQTVARVVNDLMAQHPIALLLGGDFNSTPESVVRRTLLASGLRDAWSECGRGAADSLTYDAAKPSKRIDYLYLGGNARCESATVVETQASDHRPLLVVVRVRR